MLSKIFNRSKQIPINNQRCFSAIGPPKNVLYLNSLGSETEDKDIFKELNELVPQFTTNLKYDVCSFNPDKKPKNPDSREWHAYYNQTIIKAFRWAKFYKYDGVIIGDVSLSPMSVLLATDSINAFEDIKITSLGEAACAVAKNAGKTFSIILGYTHLIPLFRDNLIKFGFEDSFKSFHALYEGDMSEKRDFYWDKQTILDKTQKALREENVGGVILASVCDLETCGRIQTRFPKVPIVYPEMAALKYNELMIDGHRSQNGAQKKKVDMNDYNDVLFDNSPIGHIIGNTDIDNKLNSK